MSLIFTHSHWRSPLFADSIPFVCVCVINARISMAQHSHFNRMRFHLLKILTGQRDWIVLCCFCLLLCLLWPTQRHSIYLSPSVAFFGVIVVANRDMRICFFFLSFFCSSLQYISAISSIHSFRSRVSENSNCLLLARQTFLQHLIAQTTDTYLC